MLKLALLPLGARIKNHIPTPMFSSRSSYKALAALALTCAAGLAQAQAYISGSISGQLAPGVYGQVNIGNAAPPQVLYAQPMWGGPVMPQVQPVYMWVPPGHSRNWRRYCGQYHACGKPVYFLRSAPPQWRAAPPPPVRYRDEGPRHWDRDDHHDRHDRRERFDRHDRRDGDRGDRDRGWGHGRGNGQGNDNGRGHGRGHGRHDD